MAKSRTTNSICTCGFCEQCVAKRIVELNAILCTCSYKKAPQVDENGDYILDQDGNPVMEDVVDEEGNKIVELECDRCREIKKLESITCYCGECRSCLHRLLEIEHSKECTCTYKTIQVEETIIDDSGESIVVMVDKVVIDIQCDRCKEIDRINNRLAEFDMFEKAYIDECDFGKYEVVDGVIKSKVAEGGRLSEIDSVRLDNLIQDELIVTTMLATAEVNEQLANTDIMTIISLEALAELNEQIIQLQEQINRLKDGVR